jgi:GT2 family glycosyltransferase
VVSDRVVAAVVTYNRKDLLIEGLEAALAQTHPLAKLFVVDNASTDGTPEALRERGLLDRPDVEYVRMERNLGGAGGFAKAVEVAREEDCDWIWLFDDDAEPLPDALERLLAAPVARAPTTAAVCSKVVYADGGAIDANQRGHLRRRLISLPESEYRPGHHPAIGYLSFVGSLVRTDVARRIDLPRADFFVWGDDVEYSQRLLGQGEIRLVSESVFLHKRETHGFQTPRSRAVNRVLPVTLHPTPMERFWMPLCGLRNYLWTKREYEGQSGLSAVGTTLQFIAKHVLVDDRPWSRVRWIVRYARDGRRGRFVNIPPAEWVRLVRAGRV